MRGIVGFFLRFEESMGVLIVDWLKLPERLGGVQNAGDILLHYLLSDPVLHMADLQRLCYNIIVSSLLSNWLMRLTRRYCFIDRLLDELYNGKLKETLDATGCSMLPDDLLQRQIDKMLSDVSSLDGDF